MVTSSPDRPIHCRTPNEGEHHAFHSRERPAVRSGRAAATRAAAQFAQRKVLTLKIAKIARKVVASAELERGLYYRGPKERQLAAPLPRRLPGLMR
jgi:hypothetical protein